MVNRFKRAHIAKAMKEGDARDYKLILEEARGCWKHGFKSIDSAPVTLACHGLDTHAEFLEVLQS